MRAGWALVLMLVFATGCGQFFPPNTAASGGTTPTPTPSPTPTQSATPGSVYVANSNPQLNSVTAYSLSTAGRLANLANSPYALGVLPSALAVNPTGTLEWVGSLLGGIYVYVINADGSLSLGNGNAPVAASLVSAMAVDPTGNYLLVVSNTGVGQAPLAYVYQIDSSNGALTQVGTQIALDAGSVTQAVFSPNGTQIFVTLGTGGIDELSFTPSNGSLGKLNIRIQPAGNSYADQGVALNPAGTFLLAAETGVNGVRVFSLSASGVPTEAPGSPYPTGLGARGVLVDRTGAYVYVTNSGTNTISAFAMASTGALTGLNGSPFTTGLSPYALAEDRTGTYLVAVNAGGGPDLQVFSIAGATAAVPGALASVATANTGSVQPAAATAVAVSP